MNPDLADADPIYINKARYVLRNNFTPEGQQYPDRCLAVMAGTLALANVRAAKAIRQGIEQKLLRDEIRQSTYQIFKVVGGL